MFGPSSRHWLMAGFASSLGFAVLTVILSSVVLTLVVSPPAIIPTARSIKTRDELRNLSYEVVGNDKRSNCIIYLHGVLSSRYEALGFSKAVLEELDAYIVSFDRPGYGESTQLRGRNFETVADDIEDLANALGVDKFYIAAVSGGGPFALATAALLPLRLKGLLLLSAAGSPGPSSAPVITQEQQQQRHPYLLKALQYPRLVSAAQALVETYVGGRALYTLWLQEEVNGIVAKFSEVDKKCIMRQHRSNYLLKVVPESTKQGTATALIQDLLLIAQPWSFDLASIPEVLQSKIHIWHGTGDLQVNHSHAHNYKKLLPKASLRIIENGGHMAYWACNEDQQKQALQQLLQS